MDGDININDLNNSMYLSGNESFEDLCGNYAERLIEDNIWGIGVYSCPDFRLIKANQKYSEYIQGVYSREYAHAEIIFKNPISNLRENNLEILLLNTMKTAKTIYLEEFKTVSYNGEIHYWNGSFTPIIKDGSVKFIILMLNEITESILQKQQLEAKNQELRSAIELQDEFLLLITHELKTPISIIASTIQTIEIRCQNELSNKMTKYLNKIRQNTYRQLKLVNNILDNTRINSGLFRLNLIKVDIIELSRIILESINVFAEQKGIKISFYYSMTNPIIETDMNLYERILLNLLSNAIKFTPAGKSIEVKIFQMEVNSEQKICIQVKDRGIGIPNDKKEMIFERFGRIDRFIDRSVGGTGIGLHLVKMLVSMMDGEIKLKSKEGVGSTFSLIFPIKHSNVSMTVQDAAIMEAANDQLITAADIEFSDIYYGA
ncbi:MAG: HAMP domain-containing sensor histidine kinase [Eubacteriales bacterium]|nr:HAMP domain-containing sensor histidine kinase [Eubacteriales bacterium]